MSALALTDRDGLYGAFKHVQACADAGIKPLLGADLALRAGADLATARRQARTPSGHGQGDAARGRPPGVGLAVPPGLRRPRLSRRRSRAAEPAGDDVPAVTRELIAEHAAGLVMLLGPASDVGQAVAARRPDLARRALARWRHLGVDAVIEVVDHLDHKSTFRAARLAELARDTRTPAVLTNAVRYLDPVDSLTAQVLDAARHLVPLGSPRLVPHNGRAYLASQAGHDGHRRARRRSDDRPGHGQRRHPADRRDRRARPQVRPRPGPRPRRRLPAPAGNRGHRVRPVQRAEGPVRARDLARPVPDGERRQPPARRQPAAGRGERPRPPRPRAGHHREDRHGRLLPHGGRRGRPDQATPASAARSGARARAASSTTCSASARSTRSSTTCSWSGSCPR